MRFDLARANSKRYETVSMKSQRSVRNIRWTSASKRVSRSSRSWPKLLSLASTYVGESGVVKRCTRNISSPRVFWSRVSRVSNSSHNSYFKLNVCAKEMTKSLRLLGIHAISGRSWEKEREVASLSAVRNPPSAAPVPLTFRPFAECLQVDIPLPENTVEYTELFIRDLTLE